MSRALPYSTCGYLQPWRILLGVVCLLALPSSMYSEEADLLKPATMVGTWTSKFSPFGGHVEQTWHFLTDGTGVSEVTATSYRLRSANENYTDVATFKWSIVNGYLLISFDRTSRFGMRFRGTFGFEPVDYKDSKLTFYSLKTKDGQFTSERDVKLVLHRKEL